MNYEQRDSLSHEINVHSITLPGQWPGLLSDGRRIVAENDNNLIIMDARDAYPSIELRNVLIVTPDNTLSNGIRFFLEHNSNVRLKVVRDHSTLQYQLNNFHPDLIFFTDINDSDARDILFALCYIREHEMDSRVVVLSDKSESFLAAIASHWPNLCCLDTRSSIEDIDNKITSELNAGVSSAPKICESLTPKQWEIIKLLAAGLTLTEIAAQLNISVKTASIHKGNAMKRLGIDKKIHQAWFLYALDNIE